jgi:hypothetical protein
MELTEEDIVNGLWVGSELMLPELLTVSSFIRCGYTFRLWLYEPVNFILPKGLIIEDANKIIPRNEAYTRRNNDPRWGIGKGSFGSPFSDLFRFKLLYERGGWWVDMDVTCLKKLEWNKPYFFRNHLHLNVIGNVIKVPPKSDLMKLSYEETLMTCNQDTENWLLPNEILNKYITQLDLLAFVEKDKVNIDDWSEVKHLLYHDVKINDDFYFFHWMNENWRHFNISKKAFVKNSTYGKLLSKHSFQFDELTAIQKQIMKVKSWFK